MTRDEKIGHMLRVMLLGFSWALVYHVGSWLLGADYPYSTFLFRPHDRFNDFWSLLPYSTEPYVERINTASYWPLNYVGLRLLNALGRAGVEWPFFLFMGTFLLGLVLISWRGLRGASRKQGAGRVALFLGCSYPVWFCLDRANLEAWPFLCVGAWVYFYERGKTGLCALALALALNLKPFPVVFLLLPLVKRQWKMLAACAVLTLLVFWLSMRSFGPEVAEQTRVMGQGLDSYNAIYVAGGRGLRFAHSLFGMAKIFSGAGVPGGPAEFDASALIRPYLAFSLASMGLLTLYLARVRREWWQQLALLVCAMNLLPFVSTDYKLLYLIFPALAWINAPSAAGKTSHSRRYDTIIGSLFALLLVPKNIGHPWGDEISLASVFNPLLMLALCAAIIAEPLLHRACAPQNCAEVQAT
jgi:hypothetical protein